MNHTLCPTVDRIRAFATGELTDQAGDTVASHLAECTTCDQHYQRCEEESHRIAAEFFEPPEVALYAQEAELQRILVRFFAAPNRRPTDLPQQQLAAGDQIRDYRLIEEIGSGGMAVVWRAHHERLNRQVALKLLQGVSAGSVELNRRFQREMAALGQLEHPNIIKATDAGDYLGMHYLAMEYVDGIDMSSLLARQQRLRIADACEIARQAAVALAYAHDNGCVHRDIKPSNLIVDSDGNLRILDLGLALLARHTGPLDRELTTHGGWLGTLDYVAPEQIDDAHHVDGRADIYALGATLYRMLTGRRPLEDYPTPLAKMRALSTGDVTSAGTWLVEIPLKLEKIILKSMARDPADRFDSASECGVALAPYTKGHDLRQLMSNHVSTKPATVVAEAQPAAMRHSSSASKNKFHTRRSLTGTFLVGFSLLVIAAIWVSRNLNRPADLTRDTPSEVIQQHAADRTSKSPGDVARWVMKRGGAVSVATDGNYRHFERGEQLPESISELRVVVLADVDLSAADLRKLGDLKSPFALNLSRTHLDPEHFEVIGRLNNLNHLDLTDTETDDRSIDYLTRLPQLGHLKVNRTRVTDAGLKAIGNLEDLIWLELEGLNISVAGIAGLRDLEKLRYLNLRSTSLTDDVLSELSRFDSLEKVWFSDTDLSEPALNAFQESFPTISVDH